MKRIYWDDATRKQRVERWENVVRVLRSLTPHQRKKHFDMSHWGEKTHCGTVACAGGHCSFDPWFRRRGFTAGFDKEGNWTDFQKMSPHEFFGKQGAERIFMDCTPRAVGKVIKECLAYIKELKTESYYTD
jgi:hypothetical protein